MKLIRASHITFMASLDNTINWRERFFSLEMAGFAYCMKTSINQKTLMH